MHWGKDQRTSRRCGRSILRGKKPVRLVQGKCWNGIALQVKARAHICIQERRCAAHQQRRTRPFLPESNERLGLSWPERPERHVESKLSLHPTPVALVDQMPVGDKHGR